MCVDESIPLPDPKSGQAFGLSGITGSGKTYAMAAWMKMFIIDYAFKRNYKAPNPMTFNDPVEPLELLWVSWPEAIGKLRSANAYNWSEDWYESLAHIPFLVLDDLGAERIKGSYAEDWAANFLDRIVDSRYRYDLPTWWTTNLDMAGMIGLYGARLVSRLAGEHPLIVMPASTKDRRFKKAAL